MPETLTEFVKELEDRIKLLEKTVSGHDNAILRLDDRVSKLERKK
jgi:hypothetical protein